MKLTHCIVPTTRWSGRVLHRLELWDPVEFAGRLHSPTDRFPQWAILRMFAHVPQHPTFYILTF